MSSVRTAIGSYKGLLLLLFCLLTFFDFPEDVYFQNIPLLLFMLLLTLDYLIKGQAALEDKRFFVAGLLSYGLGVAMVIGASINRQDSLVNFFLGSPNRGDGILFYVLLPLFVISCLNIDHVYRGSVFNITLLVFSLAVLVGVVQILTPSFLNPFMYDGVVSIFANTNSAAAFFILIGLGLGYLSVVSPKVPSRIFTAIVSITGISLGLLSKTLQAPLFLGIFVFSIFLLYAWKSFIVRFYSEAQRRFAKLFAISTLATFSFFVFPLALQELRKVNTFGIRELYWESAIRMLRENWTFGIGPGNFSRYVSEFRSIDYVETLGPNLRVDDPHNVFFSLLLSIGPIALVFMAIGAILIERGVRNTSRRYRLSLGSKALIIVIASYLTISYVSVSVIVFASTVFALTTTSKETGIRNAISLKANKQVGLSFVLASIFVLSISVWVISASSISKQMTISEANKLLIDSRLRCEVRTELLSQLSGSGASIGKSQLLDIWAVDDRCSPIAIGVARFFVENELLLQSEVVQNFLKSDPNNPNVVLIAAIASYKNGDLETLQKSREYLASFSEKAMNYADPKIEELFDGLNLS